jgi:hypothetical protein
MPSARSVDRRAADLKFGRDLGNRDGAILKHTPRLLGGRGLPLQCFVALGFAHGKLTLQIGYQLLGIG